jgi:hypothetical protein
MIAGLSLGNYLLLVDYTGRLFREGKATISREVAEILERIGSSGDRWQARLEQDKDRHCNLDHALPALPSLLLSGRAPEALVSGRAGRWPLYSSHRERYRENVESFNNWSLGRVGRSRGACGKSRGQEAIRPSPAPFPDPGISWS